MLLKMINENDESMHTQRAFQDAQNSKTKPVYKLFLTFFCIHFSIITDFKSLLPYISTLLGRWTAFSFTRGSFTGENAHSYK